MTKADVCFILEGTYPYVFGGVANWTDQYIRSHSDLTFHLLCILPPKHPKILQYELPENVLGITHVNLQELPDATGVDEEVNSKLFDFVELGDLTSFTELANHKVVPSLNSESAWELTQEIYRRDVSEGSFLNFFWVWRSLVSSLYSVLLAELPEADLYHSLCTGYAGLLLARAKNEKKKPCLLTEHGIYANERGVEIEALEESSQLKRFWVQTYQNYSRVCYEAASQIITLYEDNREIQLKHGADREKTMVIPNGVDFDVLSSVEKEFGHPPTIALIGRVVPIKEIKTFIRAVSLLVQKVPNLKAYIMGPTDEDREYYQECVALTQSHGLSQTIIFTGKVDVLRFLGKIDVLTLTSVSEAQPLVILEAGAMGIPCVATDVGACREMLVDGGIICPPLDYQAIASALERLLTDKDLYKECSINIKKRVKSRYQLSEQNSAYKKVYRQWQESDLSFANS